MKPMRATAPVMLAFYFSLRIGYGTPPKVVPPIFSASASEKNGP
jgi:hypothetical protein